MCCEIAPTWWHGMKNLIDLKEIRKIQCESSALSYPVKWSKLQVVEWLFHVRSIHWWANRTGSQVCLHWVNPFKPSCLGFYSLLTFTTPFLTLSIYLLTHDYNRVVSLPYVIQWNGLLWGNSRSSAWQVSRVTPDSSTGMSLTRTCSSPTEMFNLICVKHRTNTSSSPLSLSKLLQRPSFLHLVFLRLRTPLRLASRWPSTESSPVNSWHPAAASRTVYPLSRWLECSPKITN